MAQIQPPHPVRGTQSLYGSSADRFHRVVRIFNEMRRLYRFTRIEVPVFEHTEVFARSIGETTDVVAKEMYSFPDKGGESLTLRPEFTAGIARAYLSEGWQQYVPLKVGTWGPAFRYERPQKGRFRQFHQVDIEVIGAPEPAADVEILAFAHQFLERLEVRSSTLLRINTLGDSLSRAKWRAELQKYFERHRGELSEDSLRRLRENPLRILDSKDAADLAVASFAPKIDDFLSNEAGYFFERVLRGLDDLNIVFERDSHLVRGLDYYRHTAFEFVTDELGSQGTVLGGGRYDGLMSALGGPETPAVGWAAGVERLSLLTPQKRVFGQIFAIVPENEVSEGLAQKIAYLLRKKGLRVDYLYRGSARKRLEKLQRRGATTAIFVESIIDDPDVVGTLSIKQFRRFGHSTERSISTRLNDLFSVLSSFDLVEEGSFRGRRVDLLLRRLNT